LRYHTCLWHLDKKNLSESDICDKFIRPAMEPPAGMAWTRSIASFPCEPAVWWCVARAQRDKTTVLRADYALFLQANIPLAVVEAKDNSHAMGAGMAAGHQLR
jgi:type I restriction enzyme R subunit